MKEKIYEEFGYIVEYLTYRKEYISFFYNGFNYIVEEVTLNEEQVENLSKIVIFLENYNIFFHEVMKGLKSFIFNYDGKSFVLLKIRVFYEREISLQEIIYLSTISIDSLKLTIENPSFKMERKIDFLEQYIANYEKSYALEDLNYYIGLSETAITLSHLFESKKIVVAHKRLHKNEKTLSFYNPLNIVLDTNCRDLAEYVKCQYFENDKNYIFNLIQFLKPEDLIFYLIRLIYPSYYFDCLESIIVDNQELDCQKKISQKANDYEKNLKYLYKEIRNYVNLPQIEWLSDINNT